MSDSSDARPVDQPTRAERKRARLARPAPTRDARYDSLDLDALRKMRTQLGDEEMRVSYWRRILQARLDVLQSDQPGTVDVADLSRVLADAPSAHRRLANISMVSAEEIAPLPDLAALWAREPDPKDLVANAAVQADLVDAEARLSRHRHKLHEEIDAVTSELIARYREDPSLALIALPHQHRSAV